MQKFEFYHPILTQNYRLDWLTKIKIKDIYKLKQSSHLIESLSDTSNYVNNVMRLIMNNKALVWGITTQDQTCFFGIFQINQIKNHTANFDFEVTHPVNYDMVTELLTHMKKFASQELKLKQLFMHIQSTDQSMIELLPKLEFKLQETKNNLITFTCEI